jgi:hypothetical protein
MRLSARLPATPEPGCGDTAKIATRPGESRALTPKADGLVDVDLGPAEPADSDPTPPDGLAPALEFHPLQQCMVARLRRKDIVEIGRAWKSRGASG